MKGTTVESISQTIEIGDILILRKESYPGARCYGSEDADYICVFSGYYRPYSSRHALEIGSEKLFYDRDWSIIEFTGEDIVAKLNDATKVYKEYLKQQQDLKATLIDMYCTLLDDDTEAKEQVEYNLEDLHKRWLLGFFHEEYEKYQNMFIQPID